jgi:hypothetical protein
MLGFKKTLESPIASICGGMLLLLLAGGFGGGGNAAEPKVKVDDTSFKCITANQSAAFLRG